MTLRGWQAACTECEWTMHSVHREHAEAARQIHEETTGHKRVTVEPVTGGDPTAAKTDNSS